MGWTVDVALDGLELVLSGSLHHSRSNSNSDAWVCVALRCVSFSLQLCLMNGPTPLIVVPHFNPCPRLALSQLDPCSTRSGSTDICLWRENVSSTCAPALVCVFPGRVM